MQEYKNKAREANTRIMAIVVEGRRRAGKQDRLPERGGCNGHEKQSEEEGEPRREEKREVEGREGGRGERKGSMARIQIEERRSRDGEWRKK